jgi:hypothetical protein
MARCILSTVYQQTSWIVIQRKLEAELESIGATFGD